MGTPLQRPRSLRRQIKGHRLPIAIGLVCAAVVIVEIAAVTNGFGLLTHPASAPPKPPDLNPYDEEVSIVLSNVTYSGHATGYFPGLDEQDLCGVQCPLLRIYTDHQPDEIGFYFFFNVTNTADVSVNMSNPALGISGTNQTVFFLKTFCCYSTLSQPYSEPLVGKLRFSPSGSDGSEIGLEGYVYSTWPIAESVSGSYKLYFNVTAS